MPKFQHIKYLLLSFFLFGVFQFAHSKNAYAQTPPISCKVHTFLVNSSTKLPFSYNEPELVNGSSVSGGDNLIYVFEITNQSKNERVVLNRVTATHLRGINEPIEVLDTKPVNGNCLVGADKKITCNINYSFGESAHYPIEYLVKVTDSSAEFPNTSTSFYVETDSGNANCSSMLFIKNKELKNQIKWETSYAKLSSNNFYIRIGDKMFYGKDPVDIHSNPDPERTTLEAIWKENNVEMKIFAYFRKIENNMWELYELRSYNGSSSGDWIYYKEELGNTISSLNGQRNYASERKFLPINNDIDAEIYCKDCEFNAFMAPKITVSPSGYSLEALVGLPKGNKLTLTADPNSGLGINVLLRDSTGKIVLDQNDFRYDWRVSDPDVLDITAQTIATGPDTCAYGMYFPCPLINYSLKGKVPGEATVTISVFKDTGTSAVAKTSFDVLVKSIGGTTTEIDANELERLTDQIEEVKKELNAQKEEIQETQGILQKIIGFIKIIFGKRISF